MGNFYRGLTTLREYQFIAPNVMPVALLDGNGTPLAQGTYNGELVVSVNRDGSVARGTAGPSSPPDIYAPGWAASLWERAPQPTAPAGPLIELPASLPDSLPG